MSVRVTLAGVLAGLAAMTAAPAALRAQPPGYVGAEMCLSCHPDQESWRGSRHATGLTSLGSDSYSLQPGFGVVADVDGNGVDDFRQGLDLNTIRSGFDRYRPNAPVLGYDAATGYRIRIGTVQFPVRFAYGGSGRFRQLYAVKIPVGDRAGGLSAGYYVSPVQYNEITHEYVAYRPEAWYRQDGSPRFTLGAMTRQLPHEVSFDRQCAGCHFNGLSVGQDGNGEWVAAAPPAVHYLEGDPHYADLDGDGYQEQVNTGCERCHGPGLEHVISSGDPRKIIDPARDFTAEQANELCGSCHSRGQSLPQGIHDYPVDEAAQESYAANLGAPLFGRFFRSLPALWPDQETSREYGQEFQDFRRSAKWKAGMRCTDCHDPHAATAGQLRTELRVSDASGRAVTIPVTVANNTLCLACHAGRDDFQALRPEDLLDPEANRAAIADAVSQHTHHPYEPEGYPGLSRCTECHMAKVAVNAVPYDTPSHTFRVIPPEETLARREQGGMPSSCAVRCHRNYAPVFGLPLDESLTDWTEGADLQGAEWLRQYYGPAGIWWRTETESQRESGAGSGVPRARRARRR